MQKLKFGCPKCGRSYTRLEHVTRHTQKPCKPKINKHERDSATRRTRPLVHVTTNDGRRPVSRGENGLFPCLHGCGYGSSRQDGLQRHMNCCDKRILNEEKGATRALSAGLSTAETANRGGEPLNGDQPRQAGIKTVPGGEYTQKHILF